MNRPALFCFLAGVTVTLLAAQAAPPEVEITNEPHHHLAFENKSVRVFNVQIDPNTETLTHWHRHDYIVITLAPAEVLNTVKGKAPATVQFPEGDTRFVPATFAHLVRDIGPEPFRNVTIELLEDEALRAATPKWDEDRGLAVLNNGTKQILFVNDAVRATEFELQPGGAVPMHHHASPHLLVAVTDVDLRDNVQGKNGTQGLMPAHFKAGESKWFLANYSHALTNTGTKAAKFVTLEFP